MNTMTYQGYMARIEFDERNNIFVGRFLGLRSIISFHGETVKQLRTAFKSAVDDYIADCKEQGVTPERPASGKLMLRVPPEIHSKALIAAQASGKSLNQGLRRRLNAQWKPRADRSFDTDMHAGMRLAAQCDCVPVKSNVRRLGRLTAWPPKKRWRSLSRPPSCRRWIACSLLRRQQRREPRPLGHPTTPGLPQQAIGMSDASGCGCSRSRRTTGRGRP